jgi:hypothetical protein
MNILTTRQMAERCNVSPRWIRRLAAAGRIHPCQRVHKNWLFTPSSTVIRPPERWRREPQKLRLPHQQLTVREQIKHAKHWL